MNKTIEEKLEEEIFQMISDKIADTLINNSEVFLEIKEEVYFRVVKIDDQEVQQIITFGEGEDGSPVIYKDIQLPEYKKYGKRELKKKVLAFL